MPALSFGIIEPGSTIPNLSFFEGDALYIYSESAGPLVDIPFNRMVWQEGEFVPGPYELVLYTPYSGSAVGGYDGQTYVVPTSAFIHARGPRIDVPGPDISYDGLSFEANLSGPGPYADLTGKVKVFGNPIGYGLQIILEPSAAAPQFPRPPRFVWPVYSSDMQRAVVPFEVLQVSAGDYSVSCAGNSLRDPLDPLAISSTAVSISMGDAPSAPLCLFASTSWQALRPYNKGVIRGSVKVLGNTDFTSDVVVEARQIVPPSPGPDFTDTSDNHAYWHVVPEWLDSEGRQDFQLGWLADGEYEVVIYTVEPSGLPGTMLVQLPVNLTISPSSREHDGIELEATL